ncbi:MAG: MFS transporter [Planctomycetes bacterium]|nr:MFS transporter [Planctomycetota bacterium]
MNSSSQRAPTRAWAVTFAGTAVNLCLGVLYAWNIWKANLVGTPEHPAGSPMTGLNDGWSYLTDAQGTWAYAMCGFVFALCMIPGGRIQDKFGPRVGATASGLFLASGCILAGLMKSYLGLIVGFGILGGIGMGLGYAAATPAAVKWFGPHQRGLIVGLVVGGYGGAAIYISPLAEFFMNQYGVSGSFIALGLIFGIVIIGAGQVLAWPPPGYTPPAPPPAKADALRGPTAMTRVDWSAPSMVKTWQFYALVFLFIGSAQSGLLVIANAKSMLGSTATAVAFLAANAWILSSFGGIVNALGRVGTGLYSDRIGRARAYLINGALAAACLFLTPTIMRSGNVWLLFLVVGVAFWQYGGGLALLPAFTADFFGSKNLGFNYGLVFLGWGIAFFIPQIAGYIKDMTGSLDGAFYLSGSLLALTVILSRLIQRPIAPGESNQS